MSGVAVHLDGLTRRFGGLTALDGLDLVVAETGARFRAPARFDDELEIYVRVSRVGRTSVTFEFSAHKIPEDILMVTAHQTLVYVDLEERQALPVPDDYRARVVEFEGTDVEH